MSKKRVVTVVMWLLFVAGFVFNLIRFGDHPCYPIFFVPAFLALVWEEQKTPHEYFCRIMIFMTCFCAALPDRFAYWNWPIKQWYGVDKFWLLLVVAIGYAWYQIYIRRHPVQKKYSFETSW